MGKNPLSSAESGYPPATYVALVVSTLGFSWMLAYMDRHIINILLDAIKTDLLITDTQVSLIQGAAFSVPFVLASIPLGRLVDRGNRRNILVVSVLVWSLGTFACAMADGFWPLFIGRMIMGFGEAALAPASMSIVADVARPSKRGLATAIMTLGVPLGGAGALLVGGVVLEAFAANGPMTVPVLGILSPWQAMFLMLSVPGPLVAWLLLTWCEPARMSQAVVAIDRKDDAFLAFVVRHKAAVGLTFGSFSMNAVIGYAISSWMPMIFMRVHHMSPTETGMIMAICILTGGTLGSLFAGWAGDKIAARFPRKGRIAVLLGLFPIQAALMLVWSAGNTMELTVVIFALSIAVVANMVTTLSYPALSMLAPGPLRGQTVAIYLVFSTLFGLALAPTGVGLITDYVFQDTAAVKQSVIAVCAAAAVVGAALAFLALGPFGRAAAEVLEIEGAGTKIF